MDERYEYVPEPRSEAPGSAEPPRRRPPTTVGLAENDPPPEAWHSRLSLRRRRLTAAGVAWLFVAVGLGLSLRTTGLLLRAIGAGLVLGGAISLGWMLWALRIAPRLVLRRERRWLARRRQELGPPPRPAV